MNVLDPTFSPPQTTIVVTDYTKNEKLKSVLSTWGLVMADASQKPILAKRCRREHAQRRATPQMYSMVLLFSIQDTKVSFRDNHVSRARMLGLRPGMYITLRNLRARVREDFEAALNPDKMEPDKILITGASHDDPEVKRMKRYFIRLFWITDSLSDPKKSIKASLVLRQVPDFLSFVQDISIFRRNLERA